MKEQLTWASIGLLTGIVIGLFFIPKPPDVRTVVETKVVVKKEIVNKDRVITRDIIQYKDGTTKIVEKEVIKDRIVTDTVEKEKIVDKTINYSGSAYVLWDRLEYLPTSVGLSYIIISPISLIGQYDIYEKKVRIGVMLQF